MTSLTNQNNLDFPDHPKLSISTSNLSTHLQRLSQSDSANLPNPNPEIMFCNWDYFDVYRACRGFSNLNKLGQGSFGEVYKGEHFHQKIAVKKMHKEKLKSNNPIPQSGKSEEAHRHFDTYLTELKVLHAYPATNILSLMAISYTEDMSTDPCLIYEYMPNGTVSDRLQQKNGTSPLTWSQRANIVKGTARGLCYLHANNIIHGDIKSCNILLDRYFEAKIGDLGLARGGSNDSQLSWRQVSTIAGTSWYLPDDYLRNFQLHVSVDTFGYGIVLYEIVTGKSICWFDPDTNQSMREIMMTATEPEPWVDKHATGSPNWVPWLFYLGKTCANPKRSGRPKIDMIFEAFEILLNDDNPLHSPPTPNQLMGRQLKNQDLKNLISHETIKLIFEKRKENPTVAEKLKQ